MIDISNETLLTLGQSCREQPGNPHLSTINRWRMNGVKGVRLETVRCGGRRFTSREALTRFHERVTAAVDGASTSPRTPRQRERAIAQAESELAKAGI